LILRAKKPFGKLQGSFLPIALGGITKTGQTVAILPHFWLSLALAIAPNSLKIETLLV
jgi:hypothetical protein